MKKSYEINLELSESEMSFVRQALSMMNDMANDLAFDEIPTAFVEPGKQIVVDSDMARTIRTRMNEAVNQLITAKSVCDKFGVNVPEYK